LTKWLKKVVQAHILELANRATKVGGSGYLLTK